MLGKYLRIQGEQMPNPVNWSENLNPIEAEYYTENGTRKTIPTRLDRKSWTGEFQCTSYMKAKIETFCKLARIECLVNNVRYEGTLRMTGAPTLVENTEFIEDTDGLWTLSVTFESF